MKAKRILLWAGLAIMIGLSSCASRHYGCHDHHTYGDKYNYW